MESVREEQAAAGVVAGEEQADGGEELGWRLGGGDSGLEWRGRAVAMAWLRRRWLNTRWQVWDDHWWRGLRWLGAATTRARARETTRERMGKEKAGRVFILAQYQDLWRRARGHVGTVSDLACQRVRYLSATACGVEQRVETQK